MKNRTLYQQLETQYTKFKTRLQKAVDSGRFAAYSAFKQQQWLQRLRRYQTQLQRLGAGVAVVAALGVGNNVQAQQVPNYTFVEETGTNNPFNGLNISDQVSRLVFVDIDGDLDDDVFVERVIYANNSSTLYYENTGSATSPVYTPRVGTANPLSGIGSGFIFKRGLSFVDIDGDTDLDLVGSSTGNDYNVTSSTARVYYAENVGSRTNPVFSDRTTTASNPFTDIETYVNGLGFTRDATPQLSFADVDNDGDVDCMVSVYAYYEWPSGVAADNKVLYYKNIGTSSTPQFQRQTPANNPLNSMNNAFSAIASNRLPLFFRDFDQDNTLNAITISTQSRVPIIYTDSLNTGYTVLGGTFIDQIVVDSGIPTYNVIGFTDMDKDGRQDLLVKNHVRSTNVTNIRYFRTASVIVGTDRLPSATSLVLYPNPVKDLVNWEEPLSGTVHLYNALGQEVYTRELVDAQQLDVGVLQTGMYFLEIRTKDKHYQQTLVVE